jgi:hypothetical protein
LRRFLKGPLAVVVAGTNMRDDEPLDGTPDAIVVKRLKPTGGTL